MRANCGSRGRRPRKTARSWKRRITALERVGVYVPGATAFYPSSVLMNIVPASVAGVEEIIMVSPPSFTGTIHPLVLAAAKVAGATRVFRIGGAQSIAAMAYGTGIIPAVPKITGPGNIYVTLAKRLVSSVCAIDMEAGPSEVVVLADAQADPREVAAEMLAQAEHNPDSVAILVTPSAELPGRVETVIEEELRLLERAETIRESLARFGTIYVVPGLEDAVRLTNVLAPEHLSIQVEDPMAVFEHIRNAGAVMLGGGTPVAVTDYYAGPNHILPTGRRARFSSPLSAERFPESDQLRFVFEGTASAGCRRHHAAGDIREADGARPGRGDTEMKYGRALLKDVEGYVPGEQPKDPDVIKLNTNERPLSPSPWRWKHCGT